VALRNVLSFANGDVFGMPSETATAKAWFEDPAWREEILHKLNERRLDESAIEAEASRLRLSDLQVLERLIAGIDARRDKTLCKIADLRDFFASKLCSVSQLLVAGKCEDETRAGESAGAREGESEGESEGEAEGAGAGACEASTALPEPKVSTVKRRSIAAHEGGPEREETAEDEGEVDKPGHPHSVEASAIAAE
jgi:hypothetical protein